MLEEFIQTSRTHFERAVDSGLITVQSKADTIFATVKRWKRDISLIAFQTPNPIRYFYSILLRSK